MSGQRKIIFNVEKDIKFENDYQLIKDDPKFINSYNDKKSKTQKENEDEIKQINYINLNEAENTEKNNLNSNNEKDNPNDELPQSLNEILLNDEDFACPVVKKKECKLISDFHYVTFQNSFGENTCFVNVILHLLNNIPELDEYLISLYKIDASNKDIKYKKTNNTNIKNINKFLVLLGKILNHYQNVNQENGKKSKSKNKNKKKQITIIRTLNMRKILENISSNKFPLNSIADPIEFFNFIMDILNENLNGDLHKSFYLELIDEFHCKGKNDCQNVSNKYDKDNFIYHIYIDEILKYIDQGNIKIKDYKNKLFDYSYKLFLSENYKICEKCKEEMTHNLICLNYPEFLLINCVWKESNPIVDDVIKFFSLLSLKEDLNNLFSCSNNKFNKKKPYYLLGFILYSFSLSHYIICLYNYDKQLFALFDDEAVKEYNNLYELIIDITANTLKKNSKAFFYPVMLIFTKENLYSSKIIKFNTLNDNDYSQIISKCNESIYEYELQDKINEEEKMNNYQEYIQMQIDIENSIKKKEKKTKNKKNEEKIEKEKNSMDIDEKECEEDKEQMKFIIIDNCFKNNVNECKMEKIIFNNEEKNNVNNRIEESEIHKSSNGKRNKKNNNQKGKKNEKEDKFKCQVKQKRYNKKEVNKKGRSNNKDFDTQITDFFQIEDNNLEEKNEFEKQFIGKKSLNSLLTESKDNVKLNNKKTKTRKK